MGGLKFVRDVCASDTTNVKAAEGARSRPGVSADGARGRKVTVTPHPPLRAAKAASRTARLHIRQFRSSSSLQSFVAPSSPSITPR